MTLDAGLTKGEAEAIKSGMCGVYQEIFLVEEPPTIKREMPQSKTSLRGSVQYYGDIVAPLGERWDADL